MMVLQKVHELSIGVAHALGIQNLVAAPCSSDVPISLNEMGVQTKSNQAV